VTIWRTKKLRQKRKLQQSLRLRQNLRYQQNHPKVNFPKRRTLKRKQKDNEAEL